MPDKADVPKLITELDDVRRLVERVYQEGTSYTYDFETLGTRSHRLRVAGLGIAWGPGPDDGAYILTKHDDHPYLDWEAALPILQPLLEDATMTQIAHNSLFDATILDRYGVTLHTNTYDTMVMAWLLNTETPNGLKDLILRLYGHKMTGLSELAGAEVVSWHPGKILRIDLVPIDRMLAYGIEDVVWTYRLWQDALAAIRGDENLSRIYHELYQEYLLILAQMQSDGVALDVGFLKEREEATREELDHIVAELIRLRPGEDFPAETCAGWEPVDIDTHRKELPALNDKWKDRATLRPLLYRYPTMAHKVFNPGSNLQLNKVLFGELGLAPVGDKGKTGLYSVASDVMAKLIGRDKTGFVPLLMRFSMLEKLQGTYHLGLQELVDDDGRIRTQFNATLKTGRLSSSTPNLQNIPARTDEGKLIRRAFVSRGPAWRMVVSDFSQMELRIAAHLSGDVSMIDGFHKGADPHSITAKAIFGLDCDVLEVPEKYPQFRAIGKMANFSLLYGAGAERLATSIADATKGEITPTVEEAQGYKESLLSNMPGVKEWIGYVERTVKQTGVTRTILGRPRHLPAATVYDPRNKAAYFGALRRAVNTAVQGSAADVIALAKRNIRREFMKTGWWRGLVYLGLQVHDELVFDVHESVVDRVVPRIKWHMEHAVELDVPIVAEPTTADSWYDAK